MAPGSDERQKNMGEGRKGYTAFVVNLEERS
jgi:hypothetical protein